MVTTFAHVVAAVDSSFELAHEADLGFASGLAVVVTAIVGFSFSFASEPTIGFD